MANCSEAPYSPFFKGQAAYRAYALCSVAGSAGFLWLGVMVWSNVFLDTKVAGVTWGLEYKF